MYPFSYKMTEDKKSSNQEIDLVFYGTSLSQDSLWLENYDFLQFKMNDLFDNWNAVRKNSYFVNKKISDEELEDQSGLEMIQNDNYYVKDNRIHHETLISFLLSQEKQFDVAFWVDGNNLVDIFVDTKDIRTLFDNDIRILFKRIKDFYHSLKPSGILVNIFFNEQDGTTKFCSFEDFYDYPGIWCLDTFLFLVRTMNELFQKLEPGVYQKNKIENLDEIIEKNYQIVLEELFELGMEKLEEKDKLIDAINKQYFNEKLLKNDFQVERPILHCFSNIIDQTIHNSMPAEEN
jgi:hypothetical protein